MLPLTQRGSSHGDLGLTDSCVESVLRVESADWAGWAGTVGFGLALLLDPRTRACLGTLEESE